MTEITLTSDLPPAECAARLRAATDPEGFRGWLGRRPVIGRVAGGSVRLRKRVAYHNSFQSILFGSLEPSGAGTVFRGRAGMHPLLVAVLAVSWLGGFGFAGAVVTCVGGHAAGVLIPLGGLAFLSAMAWSGRWLARGEDKFLAAFVAEVIAAREPRP